MSGNYYFRTSNFCRVNRNRSRDFAKPYGEIFGATPFIIMNINILRLFRQ